MATPPPLPIPQQVPTDQSPIATLLATLSNALPDMNAEVAHAIATTPGMTADNALIAGQATQGFSVTSSDVQTLRAQSSANQSATWRTMPASQQKMFQSAGYQPPHEGGGLLSSVGHFFSTGFKDVLQSAGVPLRAEQHAERTLMAPPRSGAQPGFWGNLFSPQNWADAWEQTSNGNRYIIPSVERQVQSTFGNDTYQLALQLATGTDPNQLIQGAYKFNGDTAASALAQQIKSPEVVKATQILQAGHMSVGRQLVRSLGLPSQGALATTLSGLTDGTLDWFGDPLVIGAKTGMVARTAKYNIRDKVDVLNAFNRGSGFQRALKFIADNHDNPAAISQAFPKLPTPVLEQIAHRAPTSAEDALDIFADNATIKSLMDYNPGQLPGRAGGGWLPVLSTPGQLRLAAKGAFTKTVDWSADGSAVVDGVKEGDVVSHVLNPVQAASQPVGMFVKRLTRLAPPQKFDVYGPRASQALGDIAAMGVTGARERQLINDFLAETNVEGKRVVFVNAMKDVFARLGVGDTPYGQQWLKNFATPGSEENPAWAAKYAPGSIDLLDLGRGPEPVGIFEQHLQTEWPVPDFKVLYAQANKLGFIHTAMGIPNYRLFDGFMQDVWKPLALARIGFSLRVAGEELFGAILRYGPANLARARLAATALKGDSPIEPGNILLDPLQKYYSKFTSSLPPGVVKNLATGTDVMAANFGAIAARGMRNVAGALAGPSYMNAARLGFENDHFVESFNEWASAHHGAGFLDGDISGPRMDIMRHGQLVPAGMVPTGSYAEIAKTHPAAGDVFAPMWWNSLHEIATSAWGRKALQTMDLPYTERLNAVADALEKSPAMASRSPLWDRTDDGRSVKDGEATRREAVMGFARRVVDAVDANVRTPVGKSPKGMYDLGAPIEITPGMNLAQHLLEVRRPPSIAVLEDIPNELKPMSIKGPVMVPLMEPNTFLAKAGELWGKGINSAFNAITRQINYISRTPIYLHNYAKSLEAYGIDLKTMEVKDGMAAEWKRMGMSDANIKKLVADSAADRATSLTTPYIHNPQLRSQFSNITRNLMPFWFAQEQFYKRWARNMKFSPWAFRQAQLISQGVAHSGFVHKDPTTGQEYFVYPGSAVVQDVLTRALSAFGYKSFLPIGAALRGQVNQASPGLERLGLPSYGPLVVIPANIVKQWFPETVKNDINTLEGPQAASTSFIRSLVPTTITRIWEDIATSPTNSAQYASAMMQAIQYLEASGHGIGAVATTNLGTYQGQGAPPPGEHLQPGDYMTNSAGTEYVVQADGVWRRNDPAALAVYQTRVKNYTRVFLVTRTLFGFTGPASPQGLFDYHHMNEDLQGLLKTLPFNDALLVFMKEHPDGGPYTVFQSSTQAGDPLPATKDAMAFLNANAGFMGSHSLAGAYFIPAVDSTGKFDLKSYETQLTEQLRLKKTPIEFWQEIAYNQAATTYFAAEDQKNAMLNNPSSVGMSRAQVSQSWTQASGQFLSANPLFAKQLGVTPSTPGSLTGGEATTYSRADLLKDLVKALNDPNVPQTQQTADIHTLVNSYLALEAMVAPLGTPGAPTMSASQRYQIEGTYANEVIAWLGDHPDMVPLYNRLIRPTLSSVLSAEAQAI